MAFVNRAFIGLGAAVGFIAGLVLGGWWVPVCTLAGALGGAIGFAASGLSDRP